MNSKFDSPRCRAVAACELTKSLAQSVTRRGALKEFGGGLAGVALACGGLGNTARGKRNEDCEAMINLGSHGWARMEREQNPKNPCRPCYPWPDKQQQTKTRHNERKSMNYQFDELTKGMAQAVTRRAALKKFGMGLAGMALACFGLANKAEAGLSRAKKCENCISHCLRVNPTWTSSQCAFSPQCVSICI